MYRTNLRKVGGSVMLAVPPALLDLLNLKAGSPVGVEVEGGDLGIRSRPRPSYELDELLARCRAAADQAEPTPEDREWLDSGPVGRELI